MDEATCVVVAAGQPKSAAIAVLAFGLTLTGVLVLLQSAAAPVSEAEPGTWMTDVDRRHAVSQALALIPFAGITFPWFIAVVHSSLGRQEDRFLDAIFTGSGAVFVVGRVRPRSRMREPLGSVPEALDAGAQRPCAGRRRASHRGLMTRPRPC